MSESRPTDRPAWNAYQLEDLVDAGQPAAARDRARLLLGTTPDDPDLLYVLARSELALGAPEQAVAAAEAAMPGMPDAHLAYGIRAQALGHLNLPAEARRSALEAVQRAPELAWCHRVLAEVTLDDDPERAFGAAVRAIELEPESPMGHHWVGRSASRTGRAWTADQAFRKVLELDPTNVYAQHFLGVRDLQRGDSFGALRRLSNAVALDPGHEQLRTHLDVPLTRGLLTCEGAVGILALMGLAPGFPPQFGLFCVIAGTAALALVLRFRLPRRARRLVWSYPRRHRGWTTLAAVAVALYTSGSVALWFSSTISRVLCGLALGLVAADLLVTWAGARRRRRGRTR